MIVISAQSTFTEQDQYQLNCLSSIFLIFFINQIFKLFINSVCSVTFSFYPINLFIVLISTDFYWFRWVTWHHQYLTTWHRQWLPPQWPRHCHTFLLRLTLCQISQWWWWKPTRRTFAWHFQFEMESCFHLSDWNTTLLSATTFSTCETLSIRHSCGGGFIIPTGVILVKIISSDLWWACWLFRILSSTVLPSFLFSKI